MTVLDLVAALRWTAVLQSDRYQPRGLVLTFAAKLCSALGWDVSRFASDLVSEYHRLRDAEESSS